MSRKVLFATPFWQERSGPEESLLALLATPVFAAQIDPVVALPARSPYVNRFEAAGVPTVEFDADLLQRTVRPGAILRWCDGVRRARREAEALLRSIRPEVAHSNMETTFGLALAARSAKVPTVHHVRSISFGRPRPAGHALLAAVRHVSDAQIAISPAVAALFPKEHQPTVIENPVSAEIYDCATRENGAGEPVVLALGRVSPRKHLELFLDIAAQVNGPVTFEVVGPVDFADTTYAENLKARAKILGIGDRVQFRGSYPAADVLAGATVLLNVGGNEGFCRVVAEAMAAGVPIVAKAEGATRDLIDHGRTGLLFSDVASGASGVQELISSPGLRRALTLAAREEAGRRFAGEAAARSVLEIYEAVADAPATRTTY